MRHADTADVAIIGGGPAGAALGIRLAEAGITSILIERMAAPAWRACGVFSSPLTSERLRELGLPAQRVAQLARPISALNLRTTRGVSCRIDYRHGYARGFDRVALDRSLLERAREVGTDVRTATVWRSIDFGSGPRDYTWLTVSPTQARSDGDKRQLRVRVVVGADGARSSLAQHLRIHRSRFYTWRSGITFHRHDPQAAPAGAPMETDFLFGDGWYIGVAPVPGSRVNIGIVAPGPWLKDRPEGVIDRVFEAFPNPRPSWMAAPITDEIRVAGSLMHGVERVAGDGFLLVGDATGFIDPLTGEGLHRALVSADMAAAAIRDWLGGDRHALEVYDRHLRSRFLSKDIVSWILQAFLARPRLFDYALRRLGSRERERRTLTLVLTDQIRASRALDPRYLLRLLVP